MTVSNVGLASVVSDPFGKTASNIMKEVMKSNVIDDDKILMLVHKNCKNKDKIQDSLHGYHIESDQRFKIKKSLDHMEYLDHLINSCEAELFKRAYPLRESFQHITQIKGISALSTIKDKTSYFGRKYSNIKKQRGHKKAIIAIARMMLISVYHMILTGEEFNSCDYEPFMNPKPNNNQSLTVEKALEFLKQSGVDIASIQVNL